MPINEVNSSFFYDGTISKGNLIRVFIRQQSQIIMEVGIAVDSLFEVN